MKVNAEGNELVLKSNNGDIAIIPKDRHDEVMGLVEEGESGQAKLNEIISSLPTEQSIAKEGTVIPKEPEVYNNKDEYNAALTDMVGKQEKFNAKVAAYNAEMEDYAVAANEYTKDSEIYNGQAKEYASAKGAYDLQAVQDSTANKALYNNTVEEMELLEQDSTPYKQENAHLLADPAPYTEVTPAAPEAPYTPIYPEQDFSTDIQYVPEEAGTQEKKQSPEDMRTHEFAASGKFYHYKNSEEVMGKLSDKLKEDGDIPKDTDYSTLNKNQARHAAYLDKVFRSKFGEDDKFNEYHASLLDYENVDERKKRAEEFILNNPDAKYEFDPTKLTPDNSGLTKEQLVDFNDLHGMFGEKTKGTGPKANIPGIRSFSMNVPPGIDYEGDSFTTKYDIGRNEYSVFHGGDTQK